MHTEIVGEGWDRLGERQVPMMVAVHQRLLQRYPDCGQLTPLATGRSLQRLLHTMVTAARLEEDSLEVAESGLLRLGRRYWGKGLRVEHLALLQEVFLEVIAEFHANCWDDHCRQAWQQVLENLVIPQLKKGLETSPSRETFQKSRALTPLVSKWVPYGRCSACH